MKKLLMSSLCVTLLLVYMQTAMAKTLEIVVYGLTCPFCADSLERKFSKMKSVHSIQVSLKTKKIRLEIDEKLLSLDTIKQTILDSGVTPSKITVLSQ